MKRFMVLALFLAALVAVAGESYLGTIRVYDGGWSNNCETSVLDAGRRLDGGTTLSDGGPLTALYNTSGFPIPAFSSGAPITIVCDQDVFTLPNRRTCDAGECPLWLATQWLPTTTTPIGFYYTAYTGYYLNDGGLQTETRTCYGGVVSIIPASGGTANCKIYGRLGNE